MDDKYEGCNIVESVVTAVPSPRKAKQRRAQKVGTHLFVRFVVSALIIGFIAVLHYYPSLPFFTGVSDVLKRVMCYDVFGRTAFGTTIFG